MNATANVAIVIAHLGRIATLTVMAVGLFPLAAAAQTAKEVKGATPLVAVPNEPPAKLVVDPPIPELAARRTSALLRRRPVVAQVHTR